MSLIKFLFFGTIIISCVLFLYNLNTVTNTTSSTTTIPISSSSSSSSLDGTDNHHRYNKSLLRSSASIQHNHHYQQSTVIGPCAINFFGLPRKFKDIVLPGIIKNVIRTNVQYNCNYFIHYYEKTNEMYNRGADVGRGGKIDTEEIRLLQEAVWNEFHSFFSSNSSNSSSSSSSSNNKSNNEPTTTGTSSTPTPPIIQFIKETETEFFTKYASLLQRIQTERNSNGKLIFEPWKHQFPITTIENVIKSWHSQQSVWDLMENYIPNNSNDSTSTSTSRSSSSSSSSSSEQTTIQSSSSASTIRYSRVAMLRSDVLYVTPIDIYSLPNGLLDTDNKYAIVPDFDNYPVNDRLFYGPVDAVQIWAAGKFNRLAQYVNEYATPGDGIHPERFLHTAIFPAIRDAGIPIVHYPFESMCFLRVRSDLSIRASDCNKRCACEHNLKVVMNLIQRPCILSTSPEKEVSFYECQDDINSPLYPPPIIDEDSTSNHPLQWNGCPRRSFKLLRKFFN